MGFSASSSQDRGWLEYYFLSALPLFLAAILPLLFEAGFILNPAHKATSPRKASGRHPSKKDQGTFALVLFFCASLFRHVGLLPRPSKKPGFVRLRHKLSAQKERFTEPFFRRSAFSTNKIA
jgi:hypothetical protein